MKKMFYACLVAVCLVASLTLVAGAVPSGLLEATTEVTEATGGFFSKLLDTLKGFVHTITTACAGNEFLAKWSVLPLALIMLVVAILGYRLYRPLSIVCGGILGFVIGFSICSMFPEVEWLTNAAPVLNWVFGILLAAGGVAMAIFLRRIAMALFLSISCGIFMAAYTSNAVFLSIVFVLSLILFTFAMKPLFIPVSSIAGSFVLVHILFGPTGLWSLSWLDATLGFAGGISMWIIVAVVVCVGCMTLQTRICRGTRYY